MTSPVALVGVTYAGFDVQLADLSIFFEITKGVDEVPTVRGEDVTVAALAGRSERNRLNDVLPIELRGWVTADPTVTELDLARASWRANMRQIRALFASNRARADLVITHEDGFMRAISARPLNILTTRLLGAEYWAGSIELEGYDDWTPISAGGVTFARPILAGTGTVT